MSPLIIGLIVLAIAIAAYVLTRPKACTTSANCTAPQICGAAGTCVAPCTATSCTAPQICNAATGVCVSWPTTPTKTGVWDSNASGKYTCPASITPGAYCTLPLAAAQAYCAGDPKCVGYLNTTDKGWYAGDPVQLTNSPPGLIASTSAPWMINTQFYANPVYVAPATTAA